MGQGAAGHGERRRAPRWRSPSSWSLRRRVLFASALALVAVLALGVLGFTLALQRILTNAATDAATLQAAQIAAVVDAGEYSPRAAVTELPAQGSLIQLIDHTGAVVVASEASIARKPLTNLRPPAGPSVTGAAAAVADEHDTHVLAVRGIRDESGATFSLVVATPLDTESRTVRTATALLVVAAALLAIALLVLIHRIIGSALQPVDRIGRQVAAISRAGSSERVTVPDSRDEIAELARTMNAMLDRMARADAATRQFVSDASHELRSPLATLRATLETAPERAEAQDRALMLAETLRMQHLVEDLLTLAKADDHGLSLRRDEVDLDDLVAAEVRRLRALGPGPVALTLVAARVIGDADRLTQVLRNVADNALRHTRGGIRIGMAIVGGDVRVDIDNNSDPIPAEQQESVFDRFTRLDESRQRDSGGSGLGLSIARTLARAHGGTLVAGTAPDGWCRFTLTLPLRDRTG